MDKNFNEISLLNEEKTEKILSEQLRQDINENSTEKHRQEVDRITQEYLSRKIREYFDRKYNV